MIHIRGSTAREVVAMVLCRSLISGFRPVASGNRERAILTLWIHMCRTRIQVSILLLEILNSKAQIINLVLPFNKGLKIILNREGAQLLVKPVTRGPSQT